jgi:hypothetical protein
VVVRPAKRSTGTGLGAGGSSPSVAAVQAQRLDPINELAWPSNAELIATAWNP